MRAVSAVTVDGKMMATWFGTSAESKPTGPIAFGSAFIEVDTGYAYLYNENNSTWVKQ